MQRRNNNDFADGLEMGYIFATHTFMQQLAPDAILQDGDMYEPIHGNGLVRVPSDMWGEKVSDHVAAFGTTWHRPDVVQPPSLADRLLEFLHEEISEESHKVIHGRTKDARIKAEGAMWAFAKVQKWVKRNKE